VASYSYNASNELTANSLGSYSYDANGNTLSDPSGKSYTWDFENRLTQAVVPGTNGGTTTFKYDPFGRRIYKQSPNFTSVFLYDDDNLIETINGSGNEVTSYAQGQHIDEPLAESHSGTVSYYAPDGLGSVTSLNTPAGTLAQSYSYDSFGNLSNLSGSVTNFLRFTAREFDTETNLYYYRARYYDPNIGRFISEDPITFKGGTDFYLYGLDSPTNLTDPSGLCPDPGGCQTPNIHNPQPRTKCSTYPDAKHRIACETLAGDDTVGQCVRGCLLDQYDTSKHEYKCDESNLHCLCFDACGYSTGLRARVARYHFGRASK
jgi:RHS repeat-associated protein